MKRQPAVSLCACLAGLFLSVGTAQAEAELEHRIRTQPMTHSGLGGGGMVKVHWARRQGSVLTQADNDAQLVEYRQAVADCLRDGPLPGYVADPPRLWPDRIEGMREDHYAAANYQITYTYSWRYGFDAAHCSLPATFVSSATLRSAAGQCLIDLIAKTVEGECDTQKHRAAAVPVSPPAPSLSPQLLQRLNAALPQPLGLTKAIAGLSCEVFDHQGRRLCATAAGSFQSFNLRPDRRFSLLLEDLGPAGSVRQAQEAQLDVRVSEQIFTPHLNGSFKIVKGR